MIYYERKLWSILVTTPLSLQLKTFKFPVTMGILAATLGLVLKKKGEHSSFLENVAGPGHLGVYQLHCAAGTSSGLPNESSIGTVLGECLSRAWHGERLV